VEETAFQQQQQNSTKTQKPNNDFVNALNSWSYFNPNFNFLQYFGIYLPETPSFILTPSSCRCKQLVGGAFSCTWEWALTSCVLG